MTGDVSCHHPNISGWQLKGVVPVTADVTPLSRSVSTRKLNVRMSREGRWQQTALQYAGGTALRRCDSGLDCFAHPLGNNLEQDHIALVKCRRAERAHVQNANQGLARNERHSQHRPDAFFPEDGVRNGGSVNPLEDQRPPLRRNSSRKTSPNRDPHTLSDLLFEAAGGPRDELVGCLVKEEDRCGVAMQEIQNLFKQKGEEVVKVVGSLDN